MVQQSSQISLSASTEFQHFGMRLDQVVADLFPDYSRSKLKEWILAGNVCVNGEPCVVPRQKMTGDEVISVEAEIEQQVVNEAQAIELDIVYEDEDILIINKPADLVVHPGAG
ncbi:MAG TPA: RNA pseudouridine synthase, partial [Alteromonas sp.]|nr:RNA pseudouridine synthase [Alteromonas sp.]